VNLSRLRLAAGFVALTFVAMAAVGLAQSGPGPAPAADSGAGPAASASPGPQRGKRAPKPSSSAGPSETPQPPQFTTLDGVWEIELQPLGKRLATYSHMTIATEGNTLSGHWLSSGVGKRHLFARTSPMTGTFDGRLISMSVTLPNGNVATYSGYVDNFADIVGMYHANDEDPGTAFTAEHRRKVKT